MNYEEKIRLAKEALNSDSYDKETIEYIFPELKETEDELTWLTNYISEEVYYLSMDIRDNEDRIKLQKLQKSLAWLETQGEQKPTELPKGEDYGIDGLYVAVDILQKTLGSVEGYQTDDGILEHKCAVSAVKKLYEQKPAWSEEDEKIMSTIMEEGDLKPSERNWLKSIKDRIQSKPRKKNIEQNLAKKYGITGIGSKHAEGKLGEMIKKKIETENVDNTNKVEPKFKVGDWVVRKDGGVFFNDRKFAQITEIDGEKHWFDTGLISLKAEDMRLWRLEDAKDGDILYSKKHNLLWRYKNTKECYFCMNLNYNSNNISKGDAIVIPNDVKPATKEQRDLLLDKILQQGQHNPIENANIENANNDISNDMSNDMPNLKVGDWVIREDGKPFRNGNKFAQIKSIKFDGNMCFLDTGRWLYSSEIRAWSIYDAKPGDVLVASDGSIFIFAGVVDYACKYYVALTLYNGLSINKEVKGGYWETSRAVHPATKEQCDLLFAKMREKGYKYNNEKKEIIRRI